MFFGTLLLSTITMRLVPPRTRIVTLVKTDTIVQFKQLQPDLNVLYVRCSGKPMEVFPMSVPVNWHYEQDSSFKKEIRFLITQRNEEQTVLYATTVPRRCLVSRILTKE